jgi:hypothetical protein
MTTFFTCPPLGLVLDHVVVPLVMLVVGPQTGLVLELDLHDLWALGNEVHIVDAH